MDAAEIYKFDLPGLIRIPGVLSPGATAVCLLPSTGAAIFWRR